MHWLFDTTGFPARWRCGVWSDQLGWTHIAADIGIATAYAAIPVLLAWLALRRRDTPFLPVYWLFVAFILSCGLCHALEAVIFWQPVYRLSAVVKTVTALVSWATVIVLIPTLPRFASLPGLASQNEGLQAEIDERKALEEELRASNRELQEFTDQVLVREERIIELKSEVNELLVELGRANRYQVSEDRS